MDFVPLFEPPEDADRFADGGFFDDDGLESALQGFVFLDVESVFVEGGGTNAAKFTAGEHGLEHVGSVKRAFGFAGADEGVHFIDEEDDLPRGLLDFVENCLEPFFEFASELCASDEGTHIESDDRLSAKPFGDISGDNALGETLGDSSFSDPGFPDQDRVVLGSSREDLDHAADFLIATDDGIEFALAGALGEINTVFFEGLEVGFGVGVGDAATLANFFQGFAETFFGGPAGVKNFSSGAFIVGEGEEDVVGRHVFISEFGGGIESGVECGLSSRAKGCPEVGGSGDFGGLIESVVEVGFDCFGVCACFEDERIGDPFRIGEQSVEEVFGFNGLLLEFGGGLLGGLECFLCFYGESVKSHT